MAAILVSHGCEIFEADCSVKMNLIIEPNQATITVGESFRPARVYTIGDCGTGELPLADLAWSTSDADIVAIEVGSRLPIGASSGTAQVVATMISEPRHRGTVDLTVVERM